MRIGLSTYSLSRAISAGEMTVPDVVDWVADHGGEHVEIVPIGYNLSETPELIGLIRERAEKRGIALSNYAVGGNLAAALDADAEAGASGGGAAFEAEIARLCGEVDIARALGVKRMRHDAAFRTDTSMGRFMQELPRLAEGCRRIAAYAAAYGIVTSVENHGYYVQASDRVLALIDAVNHPNFRLTLDIGNFMCVDEDSVSAVKKTVDRASIVHLKDFYLRPERRNPGEGWFRTAAGNYLRGAIFGHGDLDVPAALAAVKASGYDGDLSLEFEGLEECRFGSRIGLANARRLWDEA